MVYYLQEHDRHTVTSLECLMMTRPAIFNPRYKQRAYLVLKKILSLINVLYCINDQLTEF